MRGPARVNIQPPAGATVNRYVRSAILGFDRACPRNGGARTMWFLVMTLAEYVEGRPRRRSAPQNVVLIFDQFEEILTADPVAFEAKREFFGQLGRIVCTTRQIWALFALREDYLAPLDSYADQVPTHLKNRFRLDLLSRGAAQEAMVGTVAEGGRTFAPECAGETRDRPGHDEGATAGWNFEKPKAQCRTAAFAGGVQWLWERMPANNL